MNEKKNIKSVRDEGIVNPIDVKQYKITMQKRNYNCKPLKNGYEIVEKTYLLFGEIQHWIMEKELITNSHELKQSYN